MTEEHPEDKPEIYTGVGNLMDSKTSHLDDELGARLEEAFHKTTFNLHVQDVAKIANEYNPIDLAYAAPRLPANGRSILFNNLPDLESKTVFLINTDSATRAAIFRFLADQQVSEIIEQMPADEAVWVLDDLPERRYKRILDAIDAKKSSQIKELQKHSRNSAGGIMTNEFFVFTPETTIKEASFFIRDNPGIDMTRTIFIVDEQGKLQGYVPSRNLIVNPPTLSLGEVMREIEHQVTADATREEVVDLVERYKIPALPVVNSQNFLVGVISYEDIVEVIEDIADETIAWMAGTAEDVGELDHHLIKRFFARAPWLLITLCGGMISAGVMSYFQNLKEDFLVFMISFVPLINGMSGNVGVQSSTVLVRSMAIGTLSSGKKGAAILKEISLGLFTGVVFGTICAIIVSILHLTGFEEFAMQPMRIGFIVGCGLFGACLSATALGVTSPFFFARLGVDPALASGPIVTACNDLISIIIYFLISNLINGIFFSTA